MREPPRLTEERIRATLQTQYGLPVAALTFLPIGNDAASFVYDIVATNGTRYFLKVRTRQGFRAASLAVPRCLHERGIAHIVAPVPTLTGALWVDVGAFVVSLYPFLEARTATDARLTAQQWQALGATLRQIHAQPLSTTLRQIVPREMFVPSRRQMLTKLEPLLAKSTIADPSQNELREFWRAREDEMRLVIERADALGAQLRQAGLPLILCHADLHTWNVLVDAAQHMWLVDWDEVILAPKERDLMFVIGGIAHGLVSADQTARFLQGYGDAAIDQRALTYYRYAWAVQDMAAYVEDVFFSPGLGAQTRRDSVRAFVNLFAPGSIVDIARTSTF